MKKILPRTFFDRPVLTVARDMLGKYLMRRIDGKTIAILITEVEAYDGQKDLACHAHRGETPRNKVMFGPAGRWYVYFTYGMHWMLNIVTGPERYPAAVLIRGGYIKNSDGTWTRMSGPARLTKFLQIDKTLYATPANKKSGLWIEDRGYSVAKKNIITSKRVGVDYAGSLWAGKLWNFSIKPRILTAVPAQSLSRRSRP